MICTKCNTKMEPWEYEPDVAYIIYKCPKCFRMQENNIPSLEDLKRELQRKMMSLESLEEIYQNILEIHEPLKSQIGEAKLNLILALKYLKGYSKGGEE